MGENAPDMVYMGSLTNFDLSYAWTQDKCVPLVREITFENGEVCFPFSKYIFVFMRGHACTFCPHLLFVYI